VETLPALRQAGCESLPRRLPENRMLEGVVDLAGPLAQSDVEPIEGPAGVLLGINGLGHLADVLEELGVADEVGEGGYGDARIPAGSSCRSDSLAGRR